MSASSASRRASSELELFLRELAHVGVLHQLFGRGELRDDVLVLAKALDERLHFGERLRVRTELRRVRLDGGIGHLGHQLLVLRLDGRQFVEHAVAYLLVRLKPDATDGPAKAGPFDRTRPTPGAETRPRRRLRVPP